MKDVILADFSSSIAISNCGSVQVKKVTDPAGQTGSFLYELSRADESAIRFDATKSFSDTLTVDGDFDLIEDLKTGTNYTLAEGALDPAWALQTISCTTDGTTYDVYRA